jgi:hypothetical protein
MKIRSGIFSWRPVHDYTLVRQDGHAIPRKDIDMYESAPQLYAALDHILGYVSEQHREEKQKCLLVLEQAISGKKTKNFKYLTDEERAGIVE